MKKIYVSDTTLRTLCAANRSGLSFRERLCIALDLQKTGADAVELPSLSGGKEELVVCRTIASNLECTVCIPGGDSDESIRAAFECIEGAAKPCIQIVMPVSTVQMEYRYHLKAAKMVEKIRELCATASGLCENVEFVASDATRAEAGFAARCCAAAAEAGAKAVTLSDDGSVFFPEEMAALVKEVKAACDVRVYVQPGNGLNMAAACAMEAIRAGADGVKTGVDGIAADGLADIVRARGDALGISCGLDMTAIHNILASLGKDASSPVVRAEAQGKNPDSVTLDASHTLTDVTTAVGSLGYELSDADTGKVYEEFCRVVARKGKVNAAELEAIIATTAMQVPSTYHLVSYVVNSGNIITATAHVTLQKDGQNFSGVSTGDGPIDAAFHAIEQILGHHYELDDFQIQSVTKGREAMGSSLIRLRADGVLYSGNGISTDIVGACIRAYINALNKIVYEG